APNIAKATDTLTSPAVVSTGTEAGKDSGLVQQTPDPSGTAAAGNGSRFEYHVVQPGDTLWNIARRYSGTTVELLKDMNNIKQDATLTPGTKLKVIVNG
ncbi:MAG: LysM peptidoglycan-binding domain-containing protein, partial [Bacteroidota bacterium]